MAHLSAPVSGKTAVSDKKSVATDPTGSGLTLLGWVVLLVAVYGFNHTKVGHELIFYSLCLIVLFLFSANYKTIQGLLFKGGS